MDFFFLSFTDNFTWKVPNKRRITCQNFVKHVIVDNYLNLLITSIKCNYRTIWPTTRTCVWHVIETIGRSRRETLRMRSKSSLYPSWRRLLVLNWRPTTKIIHYVKDTGRLQYNTIPNRTNVKKRTWLSSGRFLSLKIAEI